MKNYSSEKGGPDPLNFLSESARAAADGLTHTVRRKRCPGGASKSQAGWQQLSGEKNLKVIMHRSLSPLASRKPSPEPRDSIPIK